MSILRDCLPAACLAMLAFSPGGYAAAAGGASPEASASPPPSTATPQMPAQDADFYALGVLLSQNPALATLNLSDRELKQVLAGFSDGYRQHPKIDDVQPYVPHIQQLQRSRQQAYVQRQKQEGSAFISKVAALPGAQKTQSGLVYVPSVEGTGNAPSAADRVKVNYTGKRIDGTVFDSSITRGEPVTFPLGGVIPCWREALQLMKVGGKARVVCPSDLAYGDTGRPPVIRPAATLDFEVELLDVMRAEAPKAPNFEKPASPAAPQSPSVPPSATSSPSNPNASPNH